MAWLYGDTFDAYVTADLPQRYGSVLGDVAISAGDGRDGTAALKCTTGNDSVGRAVNPVNASESIVSFAFYISAHGFTIQTMVCLWDGIAGRSQLVYSLNVDGSISAHALNSNQSIMQATGGTLLGTTPAGLILSNTWHYIELKTKISATVGTVTIRIDGDEVLALTGLDTRNSTASGDVYTQVYVGMSASVSGQDFYYDDLILLDTSGSVNNDFLGNLVGEVLRPNGGGNSSEWTPTAGSNYENVDDTAPDGDTTTVTTDVLNEKDTYAFSNLTRIDANIKAVQITSIAKKTTSGTRAIGHVTRSDGADYVGSDMYLSEGSYAGHSSVRELDPDTAAAWSVAAVNAAEFGQKVTV